MRTNRYFGFAAALLVGAAMAGAAPASAGSLDAAPDESWARPLSNSEMSDLRGGISGIAFSVFFTGFVDSLGNQTGTLETDTTGTLSPTVNATADGNVTISTVIGNFQGASGIFQIAQVPGNFNVVNNNLFIQVAIINGPEVPSLQSLFGLQ